VLLLLGEIHGRHSTRTKLTLDEITRRERTTRMWRDRGSGHT
jgi:hypothetical protein